MQNVTGDGGGGVLAVVLHDHGDGGLRRVERGVAYEPGVGLLGTGLGRTGLAGHVDAHDARGAARALGYRGEDVYKRQPESTAAPTGADTDAETARGGV